MWIYKFSENNEHETNKQILSGIQFVEYCRSRSNQYRPYHVHNEEFHILYCTGGRGFIRVNNVDHSLIPGKLVLIKPGIFHSCGSDENDDLEFWGISFAPCGENDTLYQFLIGSEHHAADFSGYLGYVRGAFQFIHDLSQNPFSDGGQEELMLLQLTALLQFTKVMLTDHVVSAPDVEDLPMQGVLRWIMEHYREDISLNSLARQFAMSTSHLSRTFYQAFRVSPINYLIDYRLNEAKDMLIHTDRPVHEIAAEVGYANAYYFTNLFAKRIGYTPQDFRRLCRQAGTQPIPAEFTANEDTESKEEKPT